MWSWAAIDIAIHPGALPFVVVAVDDVILLTLTELILVAAAAYCGSFCSDHPRDQGGR